MGFNHTTNQSTPHSNIQTPAPWGLGHLGLSALWAYLGCPTLLLWALRHIAPTQTLQYTTEITFAGAVLGWSLVLGYWQRTYPQLTWRAFGLKPDLRWQTVAGYTLMGILGVVTLGAAYGLVQHQLKLPAPDQLLPTIPTPLLWLMGGLLAPLLEELVFRGAVFSTFLRYCAPWVSVVLSASVFTAMHLSYQGYPAVLAYVWILGVWLGLLRLRSGSLWPCILTHGANNLFVLLTVTTLPTISF